MRYYPLEFLWGASSDEVPGLLTEAGTIEALEAKLQAMVGYRDYH